MMHLRFYQDADTSEEDYADKFHAMCKREGHQGKPPADWTETMERNAKARYNGQQSGRTRGLTALATEIRAAVTRKWKTTAQIAKETNANSSTVRDALKYDRTIEHKLECRMTKNNRPMRQNLWRRVG